MKQILLLLSLFLLSACGLKENNKQAAKTSETAVETKNETKAFQYEKTTENGKQAVTESITYKGDSIEKLHLEVTQTFKEDALANTDNENFDGVKKELLGKLEEQEVIKQLRQVKDIDLKLDITPDKALFMSISIDVKTADLEKLSKVPGLGIDFTDLKQGKPEQYIQLLKENGAREVKNSN